MNDESPKQEPQAEQTPPAPAPEQPAQAQPQPMVQQQYVVMQQSLKGVGGWLIFWLIVFSIAAVSYIYAFFTSLVIPSGFGVDGIKVVTLLFTPFLAVGYLATVVMISMQKKLGKLLAFGTLGLSALYTTISSIITYVSATNAVSSYSSYDSTSTTLPILIGGILVSLVIHGLIALYFILSRRVKETLVN